MLNFKILLFFFSAKEYITKEDSLILKLRVEMLIQESCEEFALNLCECCLEHDKFKDDLELTQKQLFLLFKLNNTDRLQEVVSYSVLYKISEQKVHWSHQKDYKLIALLVRIISL